MTLRCDMCHKPLKEKRYQIAVLLRPELTLTVGPDCYSKEVKARKEAVGRYAPEKVAAMRANLAAHHSHQ